MGMNWLKEIIGIKKFRQEQVSALNDLDTILLQDVNLAYYKRDPDPDIDIYVKSLMDASFQGIKERVRPDTVSQVVTRHLDEFGLHTFGKIKLTTDIVAITMMFFQVTRARSLRLILKQVTDDACRKFHTDAYELRLLCTYRGQGTEWINDRFVNRKKLVVGNNEDIIKDASRVCRMEPFEVAILKGEVANNSSWVNGIVHRSPPIQKTGDARLLFRLDYE